MPNILASKVVGITELKKNPASVLTAAEEKPVAILGCNRPVGYILSPAVWEAMTDRLDDAELAAMANLRLMDGKMLIEVSLEDV